MSALRLARAVTGRSRVLKFAGAYHGHVDGLLADAGSGLATQSIPASPGVPEVAAAQTVIAPFNDFAKLWELIEDPDLAAIIAEPIPANMGLVPPADGFLELLREAADQNGALLIFDEVISGFRVARGGAQERYGVVPDLTVLGKIVGGGLPAAAYGGRAELMERIAPAGDVYQAGTLSGNPLAVAAGLATLAQLDEPAYERLGQTTELLATGIRAAAAAAGVEVQVQSLPGLMTVFFAAEPVHDFAGAQACDTEAYGAWCRELLSRGVYPPTVAVRGVVPVAGALRRRHRAHDRGGGARVPGGRAVSGRERIKHQAMSTDSLYKALAARGGTLATLLVADVDVEARRAARYRGPLTGGARPARDRPGGRIRAAAGDDPGGLAAALRPPAGGHHR